VCTGRFVERTADRAETTSKRLASALHAPRSHERAQVRLAQSARSHGSAVHDSKLATASAATHMRQLGESTMGDRDRNQSYYNRNEGRYENRNESPYRDQFGPRDWESRDESWRSQSRDRGGEFRDYRDYNERSYGGPRQHEERFGAGYTGYESRRFPGTFGEYEDQRYDRDERDRNQYGERNQYGDRNQYGIASGRFYGSGYGEGNYGGSDWNRNASPERYGRNWSREGVYRGPQRDREEGFGQHLRDVSQQALRKVKRMFRGPKGYKRSDDRIREDVNDRLSQQDHFDPSDIEVSVSNGEVTLIGLVELRHEKFLAEEIADDVSGVNEVHNQLRVARAPGSQSASSAAEATTSGAQAGTEAARNRNARAQ
jgi:hypothetical protein